MIQTQEVEKSDTIFAVLLHYVLNFVLCCYEL